MEITSEVLLMDMEQPTELEERRYIKGEILFTIYENESDQFTIAKIKIHDTNEAYEEKEIVGKGYFANLQPGVLYQFFGALDRHPSFGIQYKVDSYQTFVPKTTEGLIHYLSSDLFHGVGKKTAQSIVALLGENAIVKILENPDVLFKIPRLKKKTIQSLVETLRENQGSEQVAIQLTSYGIILKMAQQLNK